MKTWKKQHNPRQRKPNRSLILCILMNLMIIFSFHSCSWNTVEEPIEYSGGVVLSFDDYNINEWQWADSILNKYNWKATFCVSGFDKLSDNEINKLLQLQQKGHEIASHSLKHLNAVEYVSEHGVQKYLEDEILPSIEGLETAGFSIQSFAYPYGSRNEEIDSALLPHFNILRALAWGKKEPSEHYCYYNNSPLVYAFSLDSNYEYSTIDYLLELLQFARDNDRILILYGHKPIETGPDGYNTKINKLEVICEYVADNRMKFLRLMDL